MADNRQMKNVALWLAIALVLCWGFCSSVIIREYVTDTRKVTFTILTTRGFDASMNPRIIDCLEQTWGDQAEFQFGDSAIGYPEGFRERTSGSVKWRQYYTGAFAEYAGSLAVQYGTDYVLVLTEADVTSGDDWDFVLGEARTDERCAVASCFRFGGGGEEYLAAQYSSVVVHEVGHMLGLWHCTENNCLMQATGGVEETGSGAQALGPQCQARVPVSKSVVVGDITSSLMRITLKTKGFLLLAFLPLIVALLVAQWLVDRSVFRASRGQILWIAFGTGLW
ncbi:MAG: matrixin family metalloprotease, partial [Chloroflexi bacterium]|nr:matrixin family metalloprotease [Chloroflexota bacterium]